MIRYMNCDIDGSEFNNIMHQYIGTCIVLNIFKKYARAITPTCRSGMEGFAGNQLVDGSSLEFSSVQLEQKLGWYGIYGRCH